MGRKSRAKREHRAGNWAPGTIVRLKERFGFTLPGTYRFEGRSAGLIHLSLGPCLLGIHDGASHLLVETEDPDFEEHIPARIAEMEKHMEQFAEICGSENVIRSEGFTAYQPPEELLRSLWELH